MGYLLLIIGGLLLLTPKTVDEDVFQAAGKLHGVDPLLLKAIAQVESGLNPQAFNPADPSYGLMQILAKTDAYGSITTSFPAVENWPPASVEQLYDPAYNVDVGAQILRWNINKYGLPKAVAVYNSWSARNEEFPFTNQQYVDKVYNNLTKLESRR